MKTNLLKDKSVWIEELRQESVERSLQVYRRARRMRNLFIVAALVSLAAGLAFPDSASHVLATPVVMGVALFLSFFTFATEWSTHRQYADSVARCESPVAR